MTECNFSKGSLKEKDCDNGTARRRQEKKDEVDVVYKLKIKGKHGSNFNTPKLRLWNVILIYYIDLFS